MIATATITTKCSNFQSLLEDTAMKLAIECYTDSQSHLCISISEFYTAQLWLWRFLETDNWVF
jgi:hypothetical protein